MVQPRPNMIWMTRIFMSSDLKLKRGRASSHVSRQGSNAAWANGAKGSRARRKLHVVKGALQHLCGKELECAVALK